MVVMVKKCYSVDAYNHIAHCIVIKVIVRMNLDISKALTVT